MYLGGLIKPDLFDGIDSLFTILVFVLPFVYYVLCEHFLDGRTLTKFLTKTKVVKYDGSQPSFMNIVGRTLARYIPLEPLSIFTGLPHAWHDSLSQTMVIRY